MKHFSEEERAEMKKAIAVEWFLKGYNITSVQRKMLEIACENHMPIIIDGVRAPAGKTTFCKFLRGIGCDAKEVWELDNEPVSTGFVIMLNMPLKKPDPDFITGLWQRAECMTDILIQIQMLNDKGLDEFEKIVNQMGKQAKYKRPSPYED